jgi:hypothetical protein
MAGLFSAVLPSSLIRRARLAVATPTNGLANTSSTENKHSSSKQQQQQQASTQAPGTNSKKAATTTTTPATAAAALNAKLLWVMQRLNILPNSHFKKEQLWTYIMHSTASESTQKQFAAFCARHVLPMKLCIRHGIPDMWRGVVWQTLADSGAARQLFSKERRSGDLSLFQRLARQTTPAAPCEAIISRDINRTFPKHAFFRDLLGPGQADLFRVLKAYSLYDPHVGYCQGMGFVAALLLLYMDAESAFWMLVSLLCSKKYNLRQLYMDGLPGLAKIFGILERLIPIYLPKLDAHFKREHVYLSMYASQWFITLFTYSFPMQCVLRIWDIFLHEGPKINLRIALAFLHLHQTKLLQLGFEDIIAEIKRVQPRLDMDVLVHEALRIKLSNKLLARLERDYMAAQQAAEAAAAKQKQAAAAAAAAALITPKKKTSSKGFEAKA